MNTAVIYFLAPQAQGEQASVLFHFQVQRVRSHTGKISQSILHPSNAYSRSWSYVEHL